MSAFITRFAPSPTGYLHLGHIASAEIVWAQARAAGGTVLLRIEDIDQTRCRPAFEEAIHEDLHWLGFDWPVPVRRQSEHFDAYADALAPLIPQGLVYRCFRTRKEIAEDSIRAPHGAPVYLGPSDPLSTDEEAERLAAGEAFSWRLSLSRALEAVSGRTLSFEETGAGPDGETGVIAVDPGPMGDVILARKDVPTSYHVAACHDDALQRVSHVIRGHDLFQTTHLHVLLQALLGWPTPVYHHHALKLGPDGKRLAKRDRSATVRALRRAGKKPDALRALARL